MNQQFRILSFEEAAAMSADQLRAAIAAGNLPPIAGADGEGDPPAAQPAPVGGEPQGTPPAAPAEATPPADESLSQIAARHRQDGGQPPAETPPSETPPAEGTPAETPPGEGEPSGEPTDPPADPESQGESYSADDVRLAIDIVNNQKDHEQYDIAKAICEDLGIPVPDADDATDPALNETPEETQMRKMQEQIDALNEAREAEQKAAEDKRIDDEFYGDLGATFLGEGESFPRDVDKWTPVESMQARLTASLGGAAAAKEVMDAVRKEWIKDYGNSKPEPDPAAAPETTRQGQPVPDDEPLPGQSMRRNLRSISSQHQQQATAGARSS